MFRKSKLLDDDDLGLDAMPPAKTIQPTTSWHPPSLLPDRSDVTLPQINSKEITAQTARMASVVPARYSSDYNVPSSPAPMSDVEQALDMTSQSSTVVGSIPFFVPQQASVHVSAIPAAPTQSAAYSHQSLSHSVPAVQHLAPIQPQPGSAAATAETVQSLGLPMFLVGQNVQALQTLASTPSLLSTFVDANGMYDQPRLTSLVQTLSQNIAPSQQHHVGAMGGYQQSSSTYAPSQQVYAPSSSSSNGGGIYGPASTSSYGPGVSGLGSSRSYGGGSAGWQNSGGTMRNGGYRGDQNNGDGNLHVSGYGPSTTQADIISLFSPYVHVDEVVMKGTFSFVNTNDPIGAKQAREALNGALLGGSPIRINIAQRKARDPAQSSYGGGSNAGSIYGNSGSSGLPPKAPVRGGPISPPTIVGIPKATPHSQMDLDNVRDDRGNPATKNLFVAGYGPGTSEAQVRDLFAQHAQIVGIIMKGTFSFVNTADRLNAINARTALSGSMLNGGVLRINFAKETGRLGTSFDLTYGTNAGGSGGSHSHYGRSY